MRNRIASAALAGAAALAAVATPSAAVAATRHPVITQVHATDMAMGLKGYVSFSARISASDASGIKSIKAMAWPLAPNGVRPTPELVAASDWLTPKAHTATSETVGIDSSVNAAYGGPGDYVAGGFGIAILVTANDGTTTYVPHAATFWLRFAGALPTHAKATSVRKGAQVTLRGRLSFADWDLVKWRANAGQRVALQFRKPGSNTWVTEGSARTAADGSVSVSAHDRATGWWRLVYGGNVKCAPITSAPVRISAR